MKKNYLLILAMLISIGSVFADPATGLKFDGTSASYIDCGNVPAVNVNHFTVEAWVNYEAYTNGYIISNEGWDGTNGAQGFSIRLNGNKLELVVGANGSWPSVTTTEDMPLNTWMHVAVSYTDSEMKIYLNGVLNATSTVGSPMVSSTQNLSLGEGSMWKGRLFNGKMSDVRFWNVVKTQEEILGSMSSLLQGTETGLVANWKMNEGSGDVIADATNNSNLTKPAAVTWFNVETPVTGPTKGLVFNGTAASYIDCGQIPAFNVNHFTAEGWVNYSSYTNGYILSNEGWDGTNGAQGFSIRLNGTKLEFVVGANAAWPSVTSTTEIPLATWMHIAVTYTDSEMQIYLNGALDTTITVSTPMVMSSQNISLGEGSMWKGRMFNGKMSDIRFWNVVKTQQEISAAMSSSLLGTENGLVANWKMNEGSGDAVADATTSYNLTKPADVVWFSQGGTTLNAVILSDIKTEVYGKTVKIFNNNASDLRISIFNITGQKILEDQLISGNVFERQINNLPGVYILRFTTENNYTFTEKILIQ